MLEMIKKSLLAGFGAAVVTKQMIQDATRALVEQGKISAEEAEKIAEDLTRDGEHQWNDVQSKISETVRKGLDNLDIGSRSDFQELKLRVENLEKRTAMLETALARAKETGHAN